MENKNQIPQNLEKGMRVKAICMGKPVGDYVVGRVDEGKAYLFVRGGANKRLSKIVSSSIDSCNRAVKCLGGNTIQGTEYYYEYDEESEHELHELPSDVLLKHSRQEVGELKAYIDELEYEIEKLRERLHRERLINKAAKAVTEEEREKYHNEITDCESVIQSLEEDLKMCD